jgi:hypothetical protein
VTDPQPPAPVVPGERVAQALADAERILAAAAVLERRYPAARPDVLDTTISELHSIARAWRRIAAAESPESAVEPPASDDTGQASPAAHGQAGPRTSAVPALPVAAVLSEAIRIRLADAMYDSVDRCARCKVCEHQIGAAVKVMAEAVASERGRIRQMAVRTQAVCTSEEGTSCYFSALLEPGKFSDDEKEI